MSFRRYVNEALKPLKTVEEISSKLDEIDKKVEELKNIYVVDGKIVQP